MGYFEAERFLTVLRARIDAHTRGRTTFNPLDFLTAKIHELRLGVVADQWLDEKAEEVKRGELSLGTLETYQSHRRIWWVQLQDTDIREVDAHVLKAFKDRITGKIKTRQGVLNNLHNMMNWAWREGIIQVVPPFPVIKGNDAAPRKAITMISQTDTLENIPEQHQDLFQFAFETGLREGEIAALKVKDVTDDVLTVQRTYTSGNHLHETTKGKNKDEVPLSDSALGIAQKNSAGKLPEAFLFVNPATGRGYLPQYIYKLWTATGSPVTFHEATRHSFCTQIARSGAHPEQMRRLMRHSDIRTTMRYTHMDLTDLRELINRRGEVVRFETGLNKRKKA
jgi:integrase